MIHSIDDVIPPMEVVKYLGPKVLFYNTKRTQGFYDIPICKHLYLEVLRQEVLEPPCISVSRTEERHSRPSRQRNDQKNRSTVFPVRMGLNFSYTSEIDITGSDDEQYRQECEHVLYRVRPQHGS
ncbi:hypothetical protein J6590_084672 [Homalodisca vitripennis]|nr:hypothetical protein J6590_084672 [Homalodisca vitripennis]